MRIVHAIWSMDPVQGGPPVVAERLARAQQQLGHDVTIAAEVAPEPRTRPVVPLPAHGMRDLFKATRPELRDVIATADIVHLHGVWEPLLACLAKACRQRGVPYLVTPHGMLDPWSLAQKKWKKRLALALGYRKMLNSAAALHVLNDDERTLLAPLHLRAPCAVIPNGIFLDEIPDHDSSFRDRQPGPGARPYILFLSRLHYKKGLDFLADAFAEIARLFPDVDLVVAGPDDGAAGPFRSQIERLDLATRVWLTGPLYGALKWSALAEAVCFVLPSRQEGFSMAILEALASRIPVVISTECHFPEVAEVGAGRIVPLDVNRIVCALREILSNPTARPRMGVAGRKLVETRFTWPQVAGRSLAVYERISRGEQPG